MSYVVVIISFNLWTLEYQINSQYMTRKVTSNSPEFSIPNDEFLILDQKEGKLFTVHPDGQYRTASPIHIADTGWQSDQYEITQTALRPVVDGPWTCVDIIESKKPTLSNPFGHEEVSKKITRLCQIPEVEHLIQQELYYKFLGFYRTDIELPFHGVITKQWMEYPGDDAIPDAEYIISHLTEIKQVPGKPEDLDVFLHWPIQNPSPK